jgi:hypothetical protein
VRGRLANTRLGLGVVFLDANGGHECVGEKKFTEISSSVELCTMVEAEPLQNPTRTVCLKRPSCARCSQWRS